MGTVMVTTGDRVHPMETIGCRKPVKAAVAIFKGMPGALAADGLYERICVQGAENGIEACVHDLPGCGTREHEDFLSYQDCIDEIKDVVAAAKSELLGSRSYFCIMGDGLAARFIIEAEEQYGLGADRFILLNPLLEDGSEQYNDLTGKMNINGRIAERCGRVPVEMVGSGQWAFITSGLFTGLEASAPLDKFGEITTEMLIACSKEESAEMQTILGLNEMAQQACMLPSAKSDIGLFRKAAVELASFCEGKVPGAPDIPAPDQEAALENMMKENTAYLHTGEMQQSKEDDGI